VNELFTTTDEGPEIEHFVPEPQLSVFVDEFHEGDPAPQSIVAVPA
jgi:hypothetical protein